MGVLSFLSVLLLLFGLLRQRNPCRWLGLLHPSPLCMVKALCLLEANSMPHNRYLIYAIQRLADGKAYVGVTHRSLDDLFTD